MKYNFYFLLLILLTSIPHVNAQTGISCNSAISISNNSYLSSETSLGPTWYTFTADSGQIGITITNFDRGDTAIQSVNLYSGNCTSLNLITTFSKLSFPILYTREHNSVPGTIYYVEVVGSNTVSSGYSLSLIIQPTPTTAPCSCPPVLVNANSTCDQVCNGSFEYLTGQITGPQQLSYACPWRDPLPYASSSDIFSTNSNNPNYSTPNNGVGTEVPHTGTTYAGFSPYCHPTYGQQAILDPDYKEYLCVPLNQPLVAGQCYQLSFYLSLAENSRYASGNFGVLFSTTPASQTGTFTQFINATPQVLFRLFKPALLGNNILHRTRHLVERLT